MNRIPHRFALLAISLSAMVLAASDVSAVEPDYAIVVSKATQKDAQWKEVVRALAAKHKAAIITFDKDVTESLEPLKKLYPRYTCFVAQPEEAGRDFVVKVHRMTRQLDDDPYGDVVWGILTGYSAKEALRIARCNKPLVVRRGAAGAGLSLDLFEEGVYYSESSKNDYTEKKRGGKPEAKHGSEDSTKELVDVFNHFKPDLFGTSGHATDRDWQIGYPPFSKGQFRCKDGVLVGVDKQNKVYPIHSPNPKIYLPWGNCLMGLIRDRQSIALAWMGSAGVNQMFGYVVPTWYGRGGGGTRNYLFSEPGRRTFAEAFFLNNQDIIHELETRFPKSARANYDKWNLEEDQSIIGRMAMKLGYTKDCPGLKDHLGLLWDRDTVAFYGDPAWEARLAPRDLPFTQELTSADGVYTFRIHAKEDCTPGVPPSMLLPKRLKDIELIGGKEFEPLVTENFLMLMKAGKFEKGKDYDVVFKASEA